MKRILQSCSMLLLATYAMAAHAQLYKWAGPDGKVTYSDMPPPQSAARVETRTLSTGTVDTASLPFELAEAVKSHPVTLYTARDCVPCDDGRKLLTARGIPFSEKTVATAEDIQRLRTAGGGDQLPLLTVGRARERGFEAGAWNRALSAAGYPETNRLPKSYRNPPAQAAAPAPLPAVAPKDEAETVANAPAATDLPPAAGNAPPGFRF